MKDQKAYDVVVVGAGNAGLLAALSAYETGARVLVLEKAPRELRGGNSYFTGAGFRFSYRAEDAPQLLSDVPESERETIEWEGYTDDQYYSDIMDISEGRIDPELATLVIKESLPTIRWMKSQGLRWEFRREDAMALRNGKIYVGSRVPWLRVKNRGVGLVNALFEILEKKNIPVSYGTKAVRLLQDKRGRVCGVTVKQKEGFQDLEAKSVILACGGFEANQEMRLKYLGSEWEAIAIRGTRYNTGDGLRMGLDIGARPAGHWGGCHAAQVDIEAPDIADLAITDESTRSGYQMGIIVNVDGKRFVDEGEDWRPFTYTKFAHQVMRQPQRMAFQIIDSKMFAYLSGRYNRGTHVKAESFEELAEKLEINVDSFVQGVKEFNAAVQPGAWDLSIKDGKKAAGISPQKSNWAIELDTPPFYAFPTKAAITFTFGGLKINSKGQVMDNEGEVVQGLFAAGEMVGFWHHRYMGGTGLMVGAVTGRVAGKGLGAG
jgi:tricarballylate dehydrogenase